MPTVAHQGYLFDARPDRVDLRDHPYQPPLVSLPPCYPSSDRIDRNLPSYSQANMILDQGQEGACTGFGLAAVINYLLWERNLKEDDTQDTPKVSTRMLYHMARLYDEWPGEAYEGSSCRGAMKGWHHHGVCQQNLWPYRNEDGRVTFITPKPGWAEDAAIRPLGAYYRINKDSLLDMQAAINEVHAVYASATVHDGWFIGKSSTLSLIKPNPTATGGHAFALVGYTPEGFIIQNSWGPDWGFGGFAILTYTDWINHGMDAWVAVMGAPIAVLKPSTTLTKLSLQETVATQTQTASLRATAGAATAPLTTEQAYQHTIVLGNDGYPINRLLSVADGDSALAVTALDLPRDWLSQTGTKKLAIYAHGGLNDEQASLKRIQIMAPYFRENDIYPLFITWRTGILESIEGIIEDNIPRWLRSDTTQVEGFLDDLKNSLDRAKEKLSEAKDRAIEVAAEKVLAKAIWSQMKQNATAAAKQPGGLVQLAKHLDSLSDQINGLEIHLVGHSAGAILLGHLLERLQRRNLKAASLSLYAPACTVEFANRHYQRAVTKGVITKSRMSFDILSEQRERADSVGPYGKSLLYLVSRALEEVHKMPLLGMEAAWYPKQYDPDHWWHKNKHSDMVSWLDFWGGTRKPRLHHQAQVSDGQGHIDLAHGSFDNDAAVVSETLKRIRGSDLRTSVTNLRGF